MSYSNILNRLGTLTELQATTAKTAIIILETLHEHRVQRTDVAIADMLDDIRESVRETVEATDVIKDSIKEIEGKIGDIDYLRDEVRTLISEIEDKE